MNDATTTSGTQGSTTEVQTTADHGPGSSGHQDPGASVPVVAVEPADTGDGQSSGEEQATEGAEHAPSLPLSAPTVVVACIVGILWWLLKRKKKAKPAPQPQPQDPTPPK